MEEHVFNSLHAVECSAYMEEHVFNSLHAEECSAYMEEHVFNSLHAVECSASCTALIKCRELPTVSLWLFKLTSVVSQSEKEHAILRVRSMYVYQNT